MLTEQETRLCVGCDVTKPLDDFRIHRTYRGAKKYIHRARKCKSCHLAEHRRWLRTNPDASERYSRANQTRRYGITPLEYAEMLEAQEGACRICMKPNLSDGKNLAIDHDHRTGKIRGLLCSNCNIGIGNFREDEHLLRAAIAYLGGE